MPNTPVISSISETDFFSQTRQALAIFNGSDVKKDSRVNAFLVTQLALKNEHQYASCFANSNAHSKAMEPNLIAKLHQLIEEGTETYIEEGLALSRLLVSLVRIADINETQFKTALLDAFGDELLSESNSDPEGLIFHNLKAMNAFIDSIDSDTSRTCKKCAFEITAGGFCTNDQCPYEDYPQSMALDEIYDESIPAREIRMEKKRIPISLSVETDDGEHVIEFSAEDYFFTALKDGTLAQDIAALEGCDFSCDGPVDTVVEFFSDGESKDLLDYCIADQKLGGETGYQATICKKDVRLWLSRYAPELANSVTL